MKCLVCGFSESKVLESRVTEGGSVIRRRRECLQCTARFTTYERALEMPLIVTKKDRTREAFDRRKVQMGMVKACEKRPISLERIEQAASEIETELRNEPSAEVSAAKVGEKVMEKLLQIDDVAYVRFASVYKEFDDAKKFAEVLAVLTGGRRRQATPARTTRAKTPNNGLAVLSKGNRGLNRSNANPAATQKRTRSSLRKPRAKG